MGGGGESDCNNQCRIVMYLCIFLYIFYFTGHKGRVLHTALSPDHSRLFSVAADGMACLWKCHESGESKHSSKAFSNGYLNSFL